MYTPFHCPRGRPATKDMLSADWYFDFISPYSYFSSLRLDALGDRVTIRHHPILLAALLQHWGQKGPAEIPSKRKWTYRWCTWLAEQNHIPFRMPAVHPFNPLPYLRLAHAADCTPQAIHTIFYALWTTGADPRGPSLVSDLAGRLEISPARLEEQAIKDALRERTDRAIAHGVFGVPTFCIDGELFWGADSVGLLQDYLADPAIFDQTEMRRADTLPIGVQR
ncbi:MAG TPA: 2-hydroxychromene-2-carboxylate isomerase, partial [Bryobacteraceae bacterium]|nr:2-hydroxychromene-2-carboxylate isomerase [Bryobacteraceae bacterium]